MLTLQRFNWIYSHLFFYSINFHPCKHGYWLFSFMFGIPLLVDCNKTEFFQFCVEGQNKELSKNKLFTNTITVRCRPLFCFSYCFTPHFLLSLSSTLTKLPSCLCRANRQPLISQSHAPLASRGDRTK